MGWLTKSKDKLEETEIIESESESPTPDESVPEPEILTPETKDTLQDKPACAWINVTSCGYSTETCYGCPYLALVKAGQMHVPGYCPVLKVS